jgi:hypothetical protein
MKRLAPALAFALIAACSGKPKQETQEPTGSGDVEPKPIYAKKILVSWGIEQQGSSANVFLQTTDETGHQVSHPVGTFAGTCTVTTPAPEMKAVIGVSCKDGATGWELHLVFQDPDLIVLKMRVDDGVTPDPMSREEVTRVKAPLGASVSAG